MVSSVTPWGNSMNMITRCLAAMLFAGPMVADADSVTYTFTGTVTSATGIYASAGNSVSGTYTIDVGAGIPSQSSPVSTANQWAIQGHGGTVYGSGSPLPNAFVFSSTLNGGGGLFYSSPPIGDAGELTSVGGITCASTYPYNYGSCKAVTGMPNSYSATQTHFYGGESNLSSQFLLIAPTGSPNPAVPYTTNGLPLFLLAQSATGSLTSTTGGNIDGQLTYDITSYNGTPFTSAPPNP
jgi:hypothetical protein